MGWGNHQGATSGIINFLLCNEYCVGEINSKLTSLAFDKILSHPSSGAELRRHNTPPLVTTGQIVAKNGQTVVGSARKDVPSSAGYLPDSGFRNR